jgi:hypothetical protein
MSINKTSNESEQQKFYKRDLQHICAEYNSENSGTCEHICLFVDNCDRNASIVPNEIMMLVAVLSESSIYEPFLIT